MKLWNPRRKKAKRKTARKKAPRRSPRRPGGGSVAAWMRMLRSLGYRKAEGYKRGVLDAAYRLASMCQPSTRDTIREAADRVGSGWNLTR